MMVWGADILDTNPRRIIVAFVQGDKYQVISDNSHFIPSENDSESPCLSDPLSEQDNNGLSIKNGTLNIEMQFWYSCGTYAVYDHHYIFRWQNNTMALIGFNHSEFWRNSASSTMHSLNYNTQRMDISTETHDDSDEKHPDKIITTEKKGLKFKKAYHYNLNDMQFEMDLGIGD
ncbi:hypothetical protein [Acinetobacter sp. c3-l95]|uniref:hypothetical protein n=1 Tax=Acinetobacter sp. c3-l95 TaxID=3342804 RepID=UPI0035BA8ADA